MLQIKLFGTVFGEISVNQQRPAEIVFLLFCFLAETFIEYKHNMLKNNLRNTISAIPSLHLDLLLKLFILSN